MSVLSLRLQYMTVYVPNPHNSNGWEGWRTRSSLNGTRQSLVSGFMYAEECR